MNRRLAITIACGIVLALLAMSLVGCGSTASPTDSVNKAFTALKAQDYETLSKYYNGDTTSLQDPEAALEDAGASQLGLGDTASNMTDEQKAVSEALAKKILEFNYSTDGEKIDGDKATVDVTITTYDFSSMLTKFFPEYIGEAFSAALSGKADQSALQDKAFELLQTSLDTLDAKDKTTTVTIPLTKSEDGTWKIDDLRENTDFADALLGGAISSISNYLNSFTSAFGSAGADQKNAA